MKCNRIDFCTIWNLLQVQIIDQSEKKRQGKRKHNEHPQNDPAVQQLWRRDEELHCYKREKLKQHDTTKRANQRFKKQNQAATSVATNHQRWQRRRDLIWDKKFVPTQQLWKSTRPNAAPSPPYPPRTSSSSGVWRGLLSASLFSFNLCLSVNCRPNPSLIFFPRRSLSLYLVFLFTSYTCTCLFIWKFLFFVLLFFFFATFCNSNVCQRGEPYKCVCACVSQVLSID